MHYLELCIGQIKRDKSKSKNWEYAMVKKYFLALGFLKLVSLTKDRHTSSSRWLELIVGECKHIEDYGSDPKKFFIFVGSDLPTKSCIPECQIICGSIIYLSK